jgi:quercetin dioxygenase-like cupin family protein
MTQLNPKATSPRPIILRPGEGHLVPGPEGIVLKATGDETAGSIGFVEATSEPGFAAPRHIHHANDELFYVLDGEFQFLVGDQVVDAPAGSFVFIPRGTVHAPKVAGAEAGKVLIVFVPGGPERAFEEFAKVAQEYGKDSPEAMAKLDAIAAAGNSEFVGPPL